MMGVGWEGGCCGGLLSRGSVGLVGRWRGLLVALGVRYALLLSGVAEMAVWSRTAVLVVARYAVEGLVLKVI
jgi:hypothetical protein